MRKPGIDCKGRKPERMGDFMRVQYGTENGRMTEADGAARPRPVRSGRITVRSSGGNGGGSQHLRLPAENLFDPQPMAGVCPVCRRGERALAEIVPGGEENFCLLRLPAEEARALGELLLRAAENARENVDKEPETEETVPPAITE